MIEQAIDERDLAFVRELEKYAGKWVAIVNYGSDNEIVVASGDSINEARREAESKGFGEATFFKAPSGQRSFVPTVSESAT